MLEWITRDHAWVPACNRAGWDEIGRSRRFRPQLEKVETFHYDPNPSCSGDSSNTHQKEQNKGPCFISIDHSNLNLSLSLLPRSGSPRSWDPPNCKQQFNGDSSELSLPQHSFPPRIFIDVPNYQMRREIARVFDVGQIKLPTVCRWPAGHGVEDASDVGSRHSAWRLIMGSYYKNPSTCQH